MCLIAKSEKNLMVPPRIIIVSKFSKKKLAKIRNFRTKMYKKALFVFYYWSPKLSCEDLAVVLQSFFIILLAQFVALRNVLFETFFDNSFYLLNGSLIWVQIWSNFGKLGIEQIFYGLHFTWKQSVKLTKLSHRILLILKGPKVFNNCIIQIILHIKTGCIFKGQQFNS